MTTPDVRVAGPLDRTAKWVFDRIVAALGLVVLSPVFLLIALWIRRGSSGPVFYRADRAGLHGRPFQVYKFRTMRHAREEHGGHTTGRADPRVTREGRILRQTKIDELPQLINVLRGEMSMVGPRPEITDYAAMYDERERVILSVRPGITDYASIEYVRLGEVVGDDNPDEAYFRLVWRRKNDLRIKYALERTFFEDVRLIFVTLWVIVRVTVRGRAA